ncbi:MAG: 3-carboxy-cis,cis-muconate cycloisomerase [Pseudomonadota bacterium]
MHEFGVSTADSLILGGLLGDSEIAALFTDDAYVAAMARFETALATAEADAGVIPPQAAAAIVERARGFSADLGAMGQGTVNAAVPTIELVKQMRAHIGGAEAAWLHWGATSQDVVDTALVLRLRDVIQIFEGRLRQVLSLLVAQAERHRKTVMPARTRYQQALPTSLGLKLASWLAPLPRQLVRLNELKPRLLCVQFGGAVGTSAALRDRGVAVMHGLADALDLGCPDMHWHTQRDNVVEFANWCAMLTSVLGKLGQDVALHQQSEIGELRESTDPARGGSSTMPQKANPIGAEALVTLARFNAAQVGNMHQAVVQENERGGPGWMLEWMTLPPMLVATGSALRQAAALAEELTADAARMQTNLASGNGLIMAEALSFALAEHMPRPDAQALVKQACRESVARNRTLVDVLKSHTDAPVDWVQAADPAQYLGVADALIDRVLKSARQALAG